MPPVCTTTSTSTTTTSTTTTTTTARPDAPVEPVAPADGSVAPLMTMANTGAVPDVGLVPPLAPRWSARLGGEVDGTPVSADGRVLVLVEGSGATRLVALDLARGRALWNVDAPEGRWLTLAGGRAFVMGASGELQAFAAVDGRPLWHVALGGPGDIDASQAVVAGSVVYANGGHRLAALAAEDGHEFWEVPGGGSGPFTYPAVVGDKLVFSHACADTVALARRNGQQVWSHSGPCEGGNGTVPSAAGGAIYVPDRDGVVLDEASGAVRGAFHHAGVLLGDGVAIAQDSGALAASDLASGRALWESASFPGWSKGSFTRTREIVAGSSIVRVSAFGAIATTDVRTGRATWAGQIPGLDETTGSQNEPPWLGAAPGVVLVSGPHRLTALQNRFRPAPRAISAGAIVADVDVGRTALIGGIVGTALRGRPVELLEARFPRRRAHRVAVGHAGPDGYVGYSARITRNTVFRFRAGGATSAAIPVFAYPVARLRSKAAGAGRVRTTARVTGPRDARLAGRRFVLYLVHGSAPLKRLGSGVLRATKPGHSVATLTFRVPSNVITTDGTTYCITRQLALGLGRRSDPFLRHCGARRIRRR